MTQRNLNPGAHAWRMLACFCVRPVWWRCCDVCHCAQGKHSRWTYVWGWMHGASLLLPTDFLLWDKKIYRHLAFLFVTCLLGSSWLQFLAQDFFLFHLPPLCFIMIIWKKILEHLFMFHWNCLKTSVEVERLKISKNYVDCHRIVKVIKREHWISEFPL